MNVLKKRKVAIVGGGSAGLIAACLISNYCEVSLFEKTKRLGNKLLVAGKGGFNLTHNDDQSSLLSNYSPSNFLQNAIQSYDCDSMRSWLKSLGIETFVGSSNRIFPVESIKPIDVVNALEACLVKNGVKVFLNHEMTDFDQGQLEFNCKGEKSINKPEIIVLALGGASWKKTGSCGTWSNLFEEKKMFCNPFQAANCGLEINWSKQLLLHEGKPVKNCTIKTKDKEVKGEFLITSYGVEGNAIYPLASSIGKESNAKIYVDFKPNNSIEELKNKWGNQQANSSNYKKCFRLDAAQMALLKEYSTKEEFVNNSQFIELLKRLPIDIDGLRPIDEAISTIGGIPTNLLTNEFELNNLSSVYTIGEMVDWDAPTGGYLLQACYSMAAYLAEKIECKIT